MSKLTEKLTKIKFQLKKESSLIQLGMGENPLNITGVSVQQEIGM